MLSNFYLSKKKLDWNERGVGAETENPNPLFSLLSFSLDRKGGTAKENYP